MNKCYIIIFDLKSPILNKKKLIAGIQSSQNWAKINESTFVITASLTAEEIRNQLLNLIYEGDKIYVSLLGNFAAWYGLDEQVSNWLRTNQR